MGFIEVLEDEEAPNPLRLAALSERAREIFRSLIEGMFEGTEFNVRVFFPEDPSALSYIISHFLPLTNTQKQVLLEKSNASERLANIIPYLEEQVEIAHRPPQVYRIGVAQLQDWIYPN
jgi:Lon protease-like protein